MDNKVAQWVFVKTGYKNCDVRFWNPVAYFDPYKFQMDWNLIEAK